MLSDGEGVGWGERANVKIGEVRPRRPLKLQI